MGLFPSQQPNAADTFKCYCCGELCPSFIMHEHHIIKKASGGSDKRTNLVYLDSRCHTALHQIEHALKNEKKRMLINDMLAQLFPSNPNAQKNCFYLATIAALGRDPAESPTRNYDDPAYEAFDTDDLVHLTPPRVPPQIKKYAAIVARELKNPSTGRAVGMSGYLRLLVEQDLHKRGFKF
jgi:hypothetical protein